MARPVNSFDVFDTLIARRCIKPARILAQLETHAQLPGLADARLAADRSLGCLGRPFNLEAIWQEVRRVLGLDQATAARLMDLEIALEHSEVIPIAENLSQVCDGDLLVSDTYLPPDIVKSLLQRAGLNKQTGLVVTNDGKQRGWIWKQLREAVAIRQHLGDNPHSDGCTASQVGIPAIIYTGSRQTPLERLLTERGWPSLANLAREIRLANPYLELTRPERLLWMATSQFSFPLLVLASLYLERHICNDKDCELFFVSRDCLLWRQLHERLFPNRRFTYLYGSRLCSIRPSASYLDYVRSVWHPNGFIVDLSSTGASWSRLFARLETRGQCFVIVHMDNSSYCAGGTNPNESPVLKSVLRASDLGQFLGKGLEMLNYAPHASVEDVKRLPNGAALPILADALEYDPALPRAIHSAFLAGMQSLSTYPNLLNGPTESVPELIRVFVQLVSADKQIPALFPNHFAADLAYERRLMD